MAGLTACIDAEPTSHDGRDAAPIAIDAGRTRPPTGEPLQLPDCEVLTEAIEAMRSQPLVSPSDGGTLAMDSGAADRTAAPDGDQSAAQGSPVAVSAGQVVITELMADPRARADTAGEWIELYNPSTSTSVELQGCAIDDGGGQRRLVEPLTIPPEGFVTVARTSDPGFTPDAVLAMSLTNTSDVVTLLCDGIVIDRVAYDGGFPIAAGASMALDPRRLDAKANDDGSAWCLATEAFDGDLGTPGGPNPSCFDDAGVE